MRKKLDFFLNKICVSVSKNSILGPEKTCILDFSQKAKEKSSHINNGILYGPLMYFTRTIHGSGEKSRHASVQKHCLLG